MYEGCIGKSAVCVFPIICRILQDAATLLAVLLAGLALLALAVFPGLRRLLYHFGIPYNSQRCTLGVVAGYGVGGWHPGPGMLRGQPMHKAIEFVGHVSVTSMLQERAQPCVLTAILFRQLEEALDGVVVACPKHC